MSIINNPPIKRIAAIIEEYPARTAGFNSFEIIVYAPIRKPVNAHMAPHKSAFLKVLTEKLVTQFSHKATSFLKL